LANKEEKDSVTLYPQIIFGIYLCQEFSDSLQSSGYDDTGGTIHSRNLGRYSIASQDWPARLGSPEVLQYKEKKIILTYHHPKNPDPITVSSRDDLATFLSNIIQMEKDLLARRDSYNPESIGLPLDAHLHSCYFVFSTEDINLYKSKLVELGAPRIESVGQYYITKGFHRTLLSDVNGKNKAILFINHKDYEKEFPSDSERKLSPKFSPIVNSILIRLYNDAFVDLIFPILLSSSQLLDSIRTEIPNEELKRQTRYDKLTRIYDMTHALRRIQIQTRRVPRIVEDVDKLNEESDRSLSEFQHRGLPLHSLKSFSESFEENLDSFETYIQSKLDIEGALLQYSTGQTFNKLSIFIGILVIFEVWAAINTWLLSLDFFVENPSYILIGTGFWGVLVITLLCSILFIIKRYQA